MPAPRRLSDPPGAARARQVTFTFDGLEVEGREGEPVAVALLLAGRRILSRSFRFHRPRGLMCSTGRCGWCECEVDGRPSVKTCRVAVRPGMVVRGEHAVPSVGFDLLGVLGFGARLVPPTFYHHRFLRPRAFRQRYLDVLRWFGGRGRLRLDGAPPTGATPRSVERMDTDVLVVGGGPGGRLAAAGAAATGVRVTILDAHEIVAPDLPAEVMRLGRTTAVGLYDGVLLAVGPDAQLEIRARAVVAATGSVESLPAIPGIDLPGVMGARTVERLITERRVLPGERAVLIGTVRDSQAIARVLDAAGARVVAKVVTADVASVTGRRAVTGIRRTDGRRHRADLVVLCERTPSLELPLAAGIETAWRDGRLVPVTDGGATPRGWFWLAGSAMGRGRTARDPERHRGIGRRAGMSLLAGQDAGSPLPSEPRHDPVPPTTEAWAARGLICFCEDVHVDELRREAAIAGGEIELVKRRTGALTGPCQGAYCLAGVAACVATAPGDARPRLATARPPLHGMRLGDLAAVDPARAAEPRPGEAG